MDNHDKCVVYVDREAFTKVMDIVNNPTPPPCGLIKLMKDRKKVDPVIEANVTLLRDRSDIGMVKYGVTLAGANYSERVILQHALEEALDLANYLQTRIMAIDADTSAKP